MPERSNQDYVTTAFPDDSLVPLESILCTEALAHRPSRPPDFEMENRTLGALVQSLADSPRTILQTLAESILKIVQADSAGVSLLVNNGKRFYWAAIAGAWQPFLAGDSPRDFGPCGDVLDCNAPLLFHHWERRYAYLREITPPAEEGLIIPFHVEGRAVGTIWVIAHDSRRQFDAEDLRRLENLARFASAAYQMTGIQKARDAARAALNLMEDAIRSRQVMETRTAELRKSEERLARELTATQELQSVSQMFLIEGGDVHSVYQKVIDAAAAIMRSDFASMQLLDESKDALRLIAFRGFDPEFGKTFEFVSQDMETSCGVARRMGRRVIVSDVETCDFIAGTPLLEIYRTMGIAAVQSTPLISRDGTLLGMLSTHWRHAHIPTENDLRQFDILTRQAADIIEQKQAEEALHRVNDELERRVMERTSELLQSEHRLRTLATELNLAEQRERARVATELHDYLAQLLVFCRMKIGQVKRTALSAQAEHFVMETEDSLGQALTYCRTLMAELSPPVLQEQGLQAGLKWLADHMKRQDLAVTVEIEEEAGTLSLPEDRAVLLFQSVRELLINVAKHATVRQAVVRMNYEYGLLCIGVYDETGFDLAAAAAAANDISPMSSKFGLYSIRERMKALGGSFNIQSAPEKGTTATLVLPLADGRREGSGVRSVVPETISRPPWPIHSHSDHPSPLTSDVSRPIRVLLVDDHIIVREGLRSIVVGSDHLVVVGEAGDGLEAIELAQQLIPDVIVMDINMPKLDGLEATKRIKTHQPDIVIIGLSVNQSVEMQQKLKAAGASAYLSKESATEALVHTIKAAVSFQRDTTARQPC